MKKILVVDDEFSVIESLRLTLKDRYKILGTESGEEAIRLIKEDMPNLVILDIIMPGIDGLETLKQIVALNKDLPVIMLTATRKVETAVVAMKMGAYDYVSKPFDVEEIKLVIEKALAAHDLLNEVKYLRSEVKNVYKFENMIGGTKEIRSIYRTIEHVAERSNTVLVYGESGTGKELVSRAIHFNSLRKDKPFIPVNCAAIPETLIESELFGHEKGAFTDAHSQKIGRFEMANGGTLFLDEIGELGLSVQAKILRVLQEREFMRVGGTKTVKVDVRLIAATNKDLELAMANGNFRPDLYYRINVVPIFIPPLRKRKKDIPLLVDHFLMKSIKNNRAELKRVSPETMDFLENYYWPGNVRELENVIERIVTLSDRDTICSDDLPANIKNNVLTSLIKNDVLEGRVPLETATKEFEKDIIVNALKKSNYIQIQTAELLGISRRMLKYKMDKLSISIDGK